LAFSIPFRVPSLNDSIITPIFRFIVPPGAAGIRPILPPPTGIVQCAPAFALS
jgi:hypothetical protein